MNENVKKNYVITNPATRIVDYDFMVTLRQDTSGEKCKTKLTGYYYTSKAEGICFFFCFFFFVLHVF